MIGISLTFAKQIQVDTDEMNNPVSSSIDMIVDNCLIAPIIEPENIREEQAMAQSREQVRIHLPKTFTGDISDSDVIWDRKVFHIDSDSTSFMDGNTPTDWNRYFRAEFVANFGSVDSSFRDGFITEDGQNFFISENSNYYFAQEPIYHLVEEVVI